ncbi:tetratricopeptide repeat protein [Pseudorhodoplanes sp.]|uniref:tetratricopeptide repeat protein n=1 Tax=Pseudorhodoplanes sp. TaxID=1934341 RepID=UPI00391D5135
MIRIRSGLIAAVLTAAIGLPGANAAGVENPAAAGGGMKLQSAAPEAKAKTPRKKKPAAEGKPRTPEKKSEQHFLDGYRLAYDLIYRKQDYDAAIAALHALGRADHPDVANLIGFASRKLGRTEDARLWYEKALAADPNHTRTWQYYGLWHLERGDRARAERHLTRIASICGTQCDDYISLRRALTGESLTY